MSGEFGERMSITLTAQSDLSAQQYNIVHFEGDNGCDVGSMTQTMASGPIGVLENKPAASGRAATVTIHGKTRVRAGAAVTAGRTFTANASGRAIHPTSGQIVIGRALEAAAADGDLISCIIFSATRVEATVT